MLARGENSLAGLCGLQSPVLALSCVLQGGSWQSIAVRKGTISTAHSPALTHLGFLQHLENTETYDSFQQGAKERLSRLQPPSQDTSGDVDTGLPVPRPSPVDRGHLLFVTVP